MDPPRHTASKVASVKHRDCGLPVIGWREWVGLPDFGIETIKVKVDTGARSSSLHAFDLHEFRRDGVQWVRFQVHPVQRSSTQTVEVEAKVLEHRSVRSSSGKAAVRPVVVTNVKLLGVIWPVELTLASRDEMGFRMLLGREAVRRRFLVDAGNSYYGGRPKRTKSAKRVKRPTRPKEQKHTKNHDLNHDLKPDLKPDLKSDLSGE